MSIKVVEAIGSETGGKDGEAGDQTGKEILIRTFKQRSYSFTECFRCIDRAMAERAVGYAKRIAECASFGYSQTNRWTGAKNIETVGAENLERAKAGDFDCSSLVIEAYRLAGCPLKMTGYTGNLGKLLLGTGDFVEVPGVCQDVEYAEAGDILNAPGKHALLIITDGSKAEPEPQTLSVLVVGNNVRIRTGCGTSYPTVKIAHKGETYIYVETDEETGWYWIRVGNAIWAITGKKRYTELIGG